MTEMPRGRSADDIERQLHVLRDDMTTLARLMKEIGESKADETKEAALAEATKLLDRSREAIDEGRFQARQTAASVEEHIREKPVQSALVALAVGFFVGLMTRR